MSTPLTPPSPVSRRERLAFSAALVLLVAVYVAGALWIAQTRGVWSPDTGARLIQVQSVLSHWPDWQVAYPAASLDPEHRNSPLYFYEFRHGGRTYVFYSFLFALVSAALFQPLGFFGLAVLPMLGGIAAGLATYGLARLLRLRFPAAPMLLVALVSPVVIYSVVFWDHSVTTGIAAVALWLGARGLVSGRTGPSWFAAGALLGAGLWFHEILLPFPVALAAGAFWVQRRRAVKPVALLFAGTVLLTLPLMLINQRVYGTPFGPHLNNLNEYAAEGSLLESLKQPLKVLLGAFYTLFGWGDVNPFFNWQILAWLTDPANTFRADALRRELTISAWLALPYVLWAAFALSGWWRRRPWGVLVSLALWAGMAAGTVWLLGRTELTHSVFFVFPPLALAFAAGSLRRSAETPPRRAEDSPDLLWSFLAVVTAVYTLVALLKPSLGGTEWGARYLLIPIPALTLMAWHVVETLWRPAESSGDARPVWGAKALLAGACALTLLSVLAQFHGLRIARDMHVRNRVLADAIAGSPDDVVISSVWWAATTAAPAYIDKKILYAGSADHPLPPLLERMRAENIHTFTLVGYTPNDLLSFAWEAGFYPVEGTEQRTAHGLFLRRYIRP